MAALDAWLACRGVEFGRLSAARRAVLVSLHRHRLIGFAAEQEQHAELMAMLEANLKIWSKDGLKRLLSPAERKPALPALFPWAFAPAGEKGADDAGWEGSTETIPAEWLNG